MAAEPSALDSPYQAIQCLSKGSKDKLHEDSQASIALAALNRPGPGRYSGPVWYCCVLRTSCPGQAMDLSCQGSPSQD